MADFQNYNEEQRARWQRRMERYNRHGHLWTGAFILLIGIAALVKATVTDLPDWVFSWQAFLIALGFFLGLKHGFRGPAWLILMLIGGIFLVNEINPEFAFRRYIWPAAIIAVGLFIILAPRKRRSWDCNKPPKKNPGDPSVSDATVVEESFDSKEDFINSTSIFGGTKKNIISKNFKGGDLTNIFGGTELDFTRADIQGTAVIDLTTIFGGTKLVVPSDWTIKYEAAAIFGGMEDKREIGSSGSNPGKVLVLKGTVVFGGTEIKSF